MACLALERLILFLIVLAHHLYNFAVVHCDQILKSAGNRPDIETIERFGYAAENGVTCFEDVPLLELYCILLVHVLGAGKHSIPIVFHTILLFYKSDCVFEHLCGVGMRARLVVNHRHGYGKIG